METDWTDCRGWGAAGVNHKLIFELDPRNFSSHFHLLETAAWLAVIWSVSIVAFIFADFLYIPAFYSPLAMMITFALFLFNPFRVLKYEARRWLIKTVVRILLAPIPLVVFADFWVSQSQPPPSLRENNKVPAFISSLTSSTRWLRLSRTSITSFVSTATTRQLWTTSGRWPATPRSAMRAPGGCPTFSSASRPTGGGPSA